MDLYKEILANVLRNEEIRITFPNLHIDAVEIVEMRCYQALKKIKTIIEDDSLKDDECFRKIEEIIQVFEQLGSSGGGRHDLG